MRVLILCTGNSCRSQMAHGFLQSFDKNIEVYSGGIEPAAQVNAKAVEVMKEVGIDISSHVPTHVNTYLDQEWDYVITVCGGANESCPAFIGKVGKRLHIGFDDPSHATGIRNLLKRNSVVCGMRLKMPSPVSILRKSEKKNCQPALAEVAVNMRILLYRLWFCDKS